MEVETREGEGGGRGPDGTDDDDSEETVDKVDPEEGICGIDTVLQEGVGMMSLGVLERSLGIVGGLEGTGVLLGSY